MSVPDFRVLATLASAAADTTATEQLRRHHYWNPDVIGGWCRLGDWWMMPPTSHAPVAVDSPSRMLARFRRTGHGSDAVSGHTTSPRGFVHELSARAVETALMYVGQAPEGSVLVPVPFEFARDLLMREP